MPLPTSTDSMRASPPLSTHRSPASATDTPAPDAAINHADAIRYWSSVSATVDGMLGGYPQISRIDLQGSRNFVGNLLRGRGNVEVEGGRAAGGGGSGGGGGGGGGVKRRKLGGGAGAGARGGERDEVLGSREDGRGDGDVEVIPDDKAPPPQPQPQPQPQASHRHPPRNTNSKTTPPTPPPPPLPPLHRAVDCGAGIGRITHGRLLSLAQTVDIVEPIPAFTAALTAAVTPSQPSIPAPQPSIPAFQPSIPASQPSIPASQPGRGRVGHIYNTGLESWHPAPNTYDLIWNQWCLGQLTDEQVVAYLRRCGRALRRGGWVVVKENVCGDGEGSGGGVDVFDEVDSSVTRCLRSFEALFRRAGLGVVRAEVQRGFPKGLGLFAVRCWALRPVGGEGGEGEGDEEDEED